MTVIYQTDVNRSGGPEEYLDKLPEEDSQFSYIKETAEAWRDNREEVDSIISEHTKGWKLERMPRVDLAILREAEAAEFHLQGRKKWRKALRDYLL